VPTNTSGESGQIDIRDADDRLAAVAVPEAARCRRELYKEMLNQR